MSFKYSVIGDNTPENREWLEKIGYRQSYSYSVGDDYIYSEVDGFYKSCSYRFYIDFFYNNPTRIIDCCSFSVGKPNPQLFRAVTAMRDDSDYMQWFKTDFENKLIPDVKEMYLCKSREFCGITVKYKEEDFVIGSAGFHKATLEELINHFKL